MATEIHYLKGDATNPYSEGNKVIVHICNDIGAWGKGFVMAITKRWKEPERQYREWHKSKENFELGAAQFVQVADDTWVANIIGQRDIRRGKTVDPPIRYDAVSKGLQKVAHFATQINASVHMPRIGCGLAGGTWDKIEPIITDTLSGLGIEVSVYDFG